jgi:uroporphyrinogen decarboxylase
MSRIDRVAERLTVIFSLPVIPMGFDRYIELIYEQPERLARLMQANEEFCVEWSTDQLAAGATAIC